MKIGTWFLALLLGFASVAYAGPAVDHGRVLRSEGVVEVREPGETTWKAPAKGARIGVGSQIKTGPGSSCDIGLGEGQSVLQMKENSQTRLRTMEPSLIRMDLQAGSIFARVRNLKKDTTFQVASPTAIASARGTGWEQSMEEVNVFENSVEVAGSAGETMTVDEGFGVDIDASGDLKEPEPVSEEDKAEYENFETQAEQLTAEEASAPAGEESVPAEEPSQTTAETPTQEESAAEETAGTENESDGFAEGFGNEDFENPSELAGETGDTEDILGEAKEEQQESETTESLEEEDLSHCYSHGGTDTSC